jgi:hypothetical protein
MFSSLSNFLPAVLHTSSPTKASQIRDDEDEDDDPGSKSDANPDETGVLKKKKDKSANEVNGPSLGVSDVYRCCVGCWDVLRRSMLRIVCPSVSSPVI